MQLLRCVAVRDLFLLKRLHKRVVKPHHDDCLHILSANSMRRKLQATLRARVFSKYNPTLNHSSFHCPDNLKITSQFSECAWLLWVRFSIGRPVYSFNLFFPDQNQVSLTTAHKNTITLFDAAKPATKKSRQRKVLQKYKASLFSFLIRS